jgi:hypothetical protein
MTGTRRLGLAVFQVYNIAETELQGVQGMSTRLQIALQEIVNMNWGTAAWTLAAMVFAAQGDCADIGFLDISQENRTSNATTTIILPSLAWSRGLAVEPNVCQSLVHVVEDEKTDEWLTVVVQTDQEGHIEVSGIDDEQLDSKLAKKVTSFWGRKGTEKSPSNAVRVSHRPSI